MIELVQTFLDRPLHVVRQRQILGGVRQLEHSLFDGGIRNILAPFVIVFTSVDLEKQGFKYWVRRASIQ